VGLSSVDGRLRADIYNAHCWQVYGMGRDTHAYAADDVVVAAHAVSHLCSNTTERS
jgi:hypothetical protein